MFDVTRRAAVGVGVAALLAAVLAGCGSTARVPDAADSPATSVQGGAGQALDPSLGQASADPGGAAAPPARQPSAGVHSDVPSPDLPPGVRRTGVVKVGFFISDDASQIYKSLGMSGASRTRDESRAIWQAVIDQVNTRGGLAGHRVVPSYYFIDSESGTNATRSQAACAQFTQDEKVAAVVLDGAGDLSMASCLAAHRTPAIDVGQTSYPYDDADLRALAPYLYLPGRLSMGRFETYIDLLAARGFFARDSRVGLLRFDLPNQLRTRREVIDPALARHGLTLTTDWAFTPVEGTGDLPRAANEASAAVLAMKNARVDRVLFLGSGLSLPYVFPTVAESQRYRPRYGITTDDGPDFMATNVPAAQMPGAMAVGWEPQYDVPDSDAVLQADPLWRQCAQVMRRAGATARDGRRCTALYFLERSLRGATEVTPAALRRGADRLGTTPYSTQTYGTEFVPGRYDGVQLVRVLRFDAGCTCFRYLTGDVPARR